MALNYYEKSDDPKIGYRKIADEYYKNKIYDKSEIYYEKSGFTQGDYKKLALAFEEIDNIDKALIYYKKLDNVEKVKKLELLKKAINSVKKVNYNEYENFSNLENPYSFKKDEAYKISSIYIISWRDEKTISVYAKYDAFFYIEESDTFYIDIGDFDNSMIKNKTFFGKKIGQTFLLKYEGTMNDRPKFTLLYIYE